MTAGSAAVPAPVLLAVAHGSRDGAAQDSVAALAKRVSLLAPALDVRVAFVQHAAPSLAEALTAAGRAEVVVVPLLLSTGYHLTADIRGAARAAGAAVADPLGPDPRLADALADRLAEAGSPTGIPTVMAAAGSIDRGAHTDVRRQADLLAERLRAPVTAAFAAAGQPTVTQAIAALHADTGRPVSLATYLLSPGHFHDRLLDAAATWISAPLGDHQEVARVVLDRFSAARQAAAK